VNDSDSPNEKHGGTNLKIKRLHPSAKMPEFAREGDAGLDLFAIEGMSVASGERTSIPTGLAMEIPRGFVGMIWDRTGVSLKKGLKVIGGVVDSSYRGDVKVLMANISSDPVEIMQGDKIAQMVIQPYEQPMIEIVDELSDTQRGDKMFGSSDEKDPDIPVVDEPTPEDYKVLEGLKISENKEEEDESEESRW
jgi:dUTP pyrophosphatase